MDATKTPKEIFSPDIQKDLLLLEEQEGSVNFKFGVVYMQSGQKCDDEMLSNGKWSIFLFFTFISHALRTDFKSIKTFYIGNAHESSRVICIRLFYITKT